MFGVGRRGPPRPSLGLVPLPAGGCLPSGDRSELGAMRPPSSSSTCPLCGARLAPNERGHGPYELEEKMRRIKVLGQSRRACDSFTDIRDDPVQPAAHLV